MGWAGGWKKLRILDIMKDSRIGNQGVIAMVVALLAGHAFSHFCTIALLSSMDYVREDLLAK